jgi:hypothetical protein
MFLHGRPNVALPHVFVITPVDASGSGTSRHGISGCRAFIAAGNRRDASEMISSACMTP